MSTPQTNAAPKPVGTEAAIQTGLQLPQPASSQIGQMQLATADTVLGQASLNGGATPNQIGVGFGYPGKLTRSDATAGNSVALLWQGQVRELADSATAGDAFAAGDIGKSYFVADENTIGKLSNVGASNRSFHGIWLGRFNKLNHVLAGVVGWVLARVAHMADNAVIAFRTAADGAASTTTAETGTARSPHHFLVTGATVAFDAAVTGSDTLYATITVSKRDLNGANPVVIATGATGLTSATTNWMGGTSTAFKPQSMTLSVVAGALNLLETDVITYAVAKASTGTQLGAGTVRLLGRVI